MFADYKSKRGISLAFVIQKQGFIFLSYILYTIEECKSMLIEDGYQLP